MFFHRLENSADTVVRIITHYLLFIGIIAVIILSFNYFTDIFVSAIMSILGIIIVYSIWAFIMFCINIGLNIKRIRELLEKNHSICNE